MLALFRPPTPEAVRLRAIRRLFRKYREKGSPEMRGLRLMRSWLSAEQLAQFDAHGYFDVIGSDSGKRYRILLGVAANIHELGRGDHPRMTWCFVPSGYLVPGDVMLAQKIALETNEYGALAVANRFPVTTPVQHRVLQHRPY